MKIIVTEEDIDRGQRRDPENCPVARALRRAGVEHCGVGGIAVMIGSGADHTMVVLPCIAQEWIMQFDWGKPVGPVEFELTLPTIEMPKPHPLPRKMRFSRSITPAPASRKTKSRARFEIPDFEAV